MSIDPEETQSAVDDFIEERTAALEEQGWSQEQIEEALGTGEEDAS
jgi:hypothetical protein